MDESDGRARSTRVGESGRHFVDGTGAPFFWLGDTQWELFRSFTVPDARAILANRKAKGFTAIQVMLVGVDPEQNVEGLLPWHDGDPLKPNEDYFRHVDEVLDANREIEGPVLAVGVYHYCRMKGVVNEGNARPWAEWVARRYAGRRDIMWSMYPRAVDDDVPVCRELAAGLRAGDDGAHIITSHPDPSPATSGSLQHDEAWLAFNCIQTFSSVELIVPMVSEDYARSPAKPVVMAEGAYEAGTEYGFDVTPLWIRRQAYYTYLAGGHHSYGHNDSWRLLPTWREALDAPGARQMGVAREALEGLSEWWRLTPDPSLLGANARSEGRILDIAARHPDGRWAIVYAGDAGVLSVDASGFGAPDAHATWVDPRDGTRLPAPDPRNSAACEFTTPPGWEDALLVIGA